MEQITINIKTGNTGNTRGSHFTPPRILTAGFAMIILIGTVLLSLPQATIDGRGLPLIDALFTATSAVCVTGLVVVNTGTHFTLFGQLVILTLIQIGGLGFMTFATLFAIILGRKISLKERLLLQEALNQVTLEGIVRLTKYVVQISLAIETAGALILTLCWSQEMGWGKAAYFALFHAVSAFNNAGFDLFNNFSSLTGYTDNLLVNATMMLLIIAGGLGFAVLADLIFQKGKKFTLHSRAVIITSLLLIAAGTVVIFVLEMNNPQTLAPYNLKTKILASLFQAVTPRTAGFSTLNIANLRDTTQLFLITLMFIGASPGSTGGGIKTTTFLSIILSVIATFKGGNNVSFRERTLPKDLIQKAVAITSLAALLVFLVTSLLTVSENMDFLEIFFESVSAFGTVGLSTGITPYLSALGKTAVIVTMYCGRLGPLTLAFALNKKAAAISHLKYPEERLIIG